MMLFYLEMEMKGLFGRFPKKIPYCYIYLSIWIIWSKVILAYIHYINYFIFKLLIN